MPALAKQYRTLLALAALTLLAAFLRFYKLDSLPPGLFGDEALASIHAREAVQTGLYPIYFVQSDGGFHPGVVYAAMLFRWLTGGHPYAIRFAMAAAGVLSIPLAFFTFRAIFALDYDEEKSWWGGLLAAFILTIIFPYLLLNRVGFEATLTAVGGLLTLWLLARGLKTGRWWFFALSGAALGLSLYAYYSLRLLPFAIVGIFIWWLWARGRGQWRSALSQLAILTVCSVIVFAPLGLFFLQNPDVFFARLNTVSVHTFRQGEVFLNLLRATGRTLASFSINGFGDFIPRHNLPYRAVFDPFLSVLFWTGVLLSFLRPKSYTSAILILWAGTMLVPVILTFNLDTPHFTRMTSAFPAFAGLCAVGALALYEALARRSPRAGYALLALGLVFSFTVSVYDYFVRWANDPSLFDAFQVGDWNAANLALADSRDHTVYISPQIITDPAHASFILLLKDGPARQFPGPDCFVYQDYPSRPLTYIVDALNDKATFDHAADIFPTGHEGSTIFHPNGWPLYQVYEVPAGSAAAPPAVIVNATFGDELKLIGYSLTADSTTAQLTLYWQALRALDADDAIFIHLYPPAPNSDFLIPPIAQSDGFPCSGRYATSRMEQGEIVVDTRTIPIPPDAPAGDLTLAAGVYEWTSTQRLAIVDGGANAILPESRLLLTTLQSSP